MLVVGGVHSIIPILQHCMCQVVHCCVSYRCMNTHLKVAYTQAHSLVHVPLWLLSHQTLMPRAERVFLLPDCAIFFFLPLWFR